MIRYIRIFLGGLIVIGVILMLTIHFWVPKVVSAILEHEDAAVTQ